MSNLSVENLAGVIQGGEIGGMIKGGDQPSVAGEAAVLREMAKQGMATPAAAPADGSFGKIISDSMAKVNEYQAQADHAAKELVAGRSKNIHETMLTLERADTSLKLMMQVRNKVLEAYKEIMKMQV